MRNLAGQLTKRLQIAMRGPSYNDYREIAAYVAASLLGILAAYVFAQIIAYNTASGIIARYVIIAFIVGASFLIFRKLLGGESARRYGFVGDLPFLGIALLFRAVFYYNILNDLVPLVRNGTISRPTMIVLVNVMMFIFSFSTLIFFRYYFLERKISPKDGAS